MCVRIKLVQDCCLFYYMCIQCVYYVLQLKHMFKVHLILSLLYFSCGNKKIICVMQLWILQVTCVWNAMHVLFIVMLSTHEQGYNY